MAINYCEEPEPLGTVGSLQLIREHLTDPFLMLNGDLITDLDLMAFRECHAACGSPLTIATTLKTVNVDLGVLDTKDGRVVAFREKPSLPMEVSMGLYIMNPELLEFIPKGVPFGFDNLMYSLLDKGISVDTYRHEGRWMDIGRVDDFSKAQEEWAEFHEKPMLGV